MSEAPQDQSRALVVSGPRLRILSDGRAGHESQTLGIAEALGIVPELRPVTPRKFYAALAPFGPIDPHEAETVSGSPIAPPWPDIALAAGRRTLPLLRRLKRASNGRVFTVYVNAPANGLRAADLIVAPVHDGLFGRNVVTPPTPANRVSAALLARLRREPDPRIAAIRAPRAALLIGGDNRHFTFSAASAGALSDVARTLFTQGFGVMATASRRTPQLVVDALKPAIGEGGGWLWDGSGENPYFSILSLAEVIIVTADSLSMIGEAVATGAPVHIFSPSGGSRKVADYLARLEALGAVRPWSGVAERWSYEPIQSTPKIAEAVRRAYQDFRGLAD